MATSSAMQPTVPYTFAQKLTERPLPATICWLPPRAVGVGCRPEEGAFNHPVVVVSPYDHGDHDLVDVYLLTSFGGRPIAETSRPPAVMMYYVPIHPAGANPTIGSVMLELMSGRLSKNSYVQVQERYTFYWNELQRYPANGAMRLTKNSYQVMMGEGGKDTTELARKHRRGLEYYGHERITLHFGIILNLNIL
ncbi:uncharacterized protein JN550_008899 [Neoarthrinium moseri]|uniref:uncharacterized protein n=1 Tax=Neoarthrinium moseri TaxID=1658444 RepID=UPI001FDAD058|nr:uncharacterized protein JN550_008899 [Neoarthrinium moseri]KAI1864342.1 hypothetical protein JN550_008899 [Neoarthrinium moseri]